MKSNYAKLHEISKKTALLSSIQSLLEWDQETYMPQEGIAVRPEQNALVAALIHKERTSRSFSKALGKLIDLSSGALLDSSLTPQEARGVKEWRRDYIKMTKLPQSFVKTFAKTTAQALQVWAEAKEKKSFRLFVPHLEKIVSLLKKKADFLGFQEHPYDALLDLYEPEMTRQKLRALFSRLKPQLKDLLQKCAKKPVPADFLFGNFPHDKQMEFSHTLLKAMGFDDKTSRLDLSHHPFCIGLHPKDTRMTSRIHPTSLMSNILSVIHEGGHGLYNQGLKEEHFGSPLGEPISLGIDESQSRMWETLIGHSLAFWKHFFPELQKKFPEKLSSVSLEHFYRAINRTEPSFIRTEADEVTYPLHIILRFELESQLIEGTLKVKEIPDAWNAKMHELLGITPPNDSEGCLQDIHWAMGGIGYFPTYTLGTLYAAQFFAAFEKQHPTWKERVEKGDLSQIRAWLRTNIHQWGKEFTAEELAQRVTGSVLSEKAFIEYLHKKYT